jgi:hypothetical protein
MILALQPYISYGEDVVNSGNNITMKERVVNFVDRVFSDIKNLVFCKETHAISPNRPVPPAQLGSYTLNPPHRQPDKEDVKGLLNEISRGPTSKK